MGTPADSTPPRLLVVDDSPAIHEDFLKILCPARRATDAAFLNVAAQLFGEGPELPPTGQFAVDSAFQGQEALERVRVALREGRPYAVAFVDVRMPPGWDGIETVARIWKEQPDLQVVICTAYSDYSREQMLSKLGESDNLVILKKPFDSVEVQQLAHALAQKWAVTRQAHARLADLDERVRQRTDELLAANERLQAEVQRRALIEGALRESEERFHKAFDNATVGLAIFRVSDQLCTDANGSFAQLVGRPKANLLGCDLKVLGLFSDAEHWNELLQQARGGAKVLGVEVTIRHADGEFRHALVSVEAVTLGGDTCFLASFADVTEQRRLETQLRQSQKMEAVGQLAAGVAHDFNNLLTIINGYASIQLAKPGLDRDVSKAFEQVKQAADRASALTSQLLAFSRKQVVQRRPLNLNGVVTRMQNMLSRMVGETIEFTWQLTPDLPAVSADESNVEQILMNLVVNARDAMPGGGRASVATRLTRFTPAQASRRTDARPGCYVEVIVADTGCGMDAKTLSRVFEPFFTTKPTGKGTGLGLATIYGIVKQHEGWVEVESAPGRGSTFRVFLPVCEEESSAAMGRLASSPFPLARGADETILVVEDEPAVREYVTTVLTMNGYRVFEASCGPEALTVWQNAERKIQLLLTDMVMPNGLTGSMLARRLVEQDRDLRVVYTSGYSAEVVASSPILKDSINFLPKPFDQQRLLKTVRQALDARPAALELAAG